MFLGLGMPLVGVFALPMFACGCGGGASLKAQTMSNMKQLVMATLVYASDHDDRLPPDMRDAQVALASVIKVAKSDEKPNPNVASSVYPIRRVFGANKSLSGVSLDKIDNPDATLLYYQEGARQDGYLTVGLVEGLVKNLPKTAVTSALRQGGILPAAVKR